MNKSVIAYCSDELERKEVLSEARVLYKSKLLSKDQWERINSVYVSKLYTPSIFMKILLFIFSLIGMSTIFGPIALLLDNAGEFAYRFMAVLLGFSLLIFTELVLIKRKSHYKSGITEAGIFSGLAFLYYGILGFDVDHLVVYFIVGFTFMTFAAIRYLNRVALVLAVIFFSLVLFKILEGFGGEAFMPFVFMLVFAFLYWLISMVQTKMANIIFQDHFIILKTVSLLMLYLSVNYYVVRQLSTELMDINIPDNGDIPFAFIFYLLTVMVPVGYLYQGIKKKSILWIRVGLLTAALGAATFKYYFSLGHPVLVFTITGALLIIIAIGILNYLKKIKGGFTRDLLLHDKWDSKDLAAVIASQTLGGNKAVGHTPDDNIVFQGGKFGGGGAEGNW